MEDNNASTVKLNQMKSILRVCLDDIEEGLKDLKISLSDELDDINLVNTTYYSLKVETLFEIEKILQNFPLKNKPYPLSSQINHLKIGTFPAHLLSIKFAIDHRLWVINSKLQVIREYIELSNSVTKCYTLAKSVRNIGALFSDLEQEMEETSNKPEREFLFSKYLSFNSTNILEPISARYFLESRKQLEREMESQFNHNQTILENSKFKVDQAEHNTEALKQECIRLQSQLNEITLAVDTAQLKLSQKSETVSPHRDDAHLKPQPLSHSSSSDSENSYYGQPRRRLDTTKGTNNSGERIMQSELEELLLDLDAQKPKAYKQPEQTVNSNNNSEEVKPKQSENQPSPQQNQNQLNETSQNQTSQNPPQQATTQNQVTTQPTKSEPPAQPPGRISFRKKVRESEEAMFDEWLLSQSAEPSRTQSTTSSFLPRAVSQGPTPNPTVRLKVSYNGTKELMTFQTNILVEEAIAQITKSHPGLNHKTAIDLQYGLFIPYPLGIWLGQKSKLEKYAFKDGTELELKAKGPVGFKQQNDKGEQLQYLTINIPASNVSRTLSFNKETTTVKDVITKITAKYIVQDVYDWVLYNPEKSSFLDPDASLLTLDLKHMQQLLFEKIPENKQILGVDPSKLPSAQDVNSFKVPVLLIELKKNLYQINALSQPRIFLKEGDQTRMKQLFNKLAFNHKFKITEEDAYSVASMVLHFYLRMSRPVFFGVNLDLFMSDLPNKNVLSSLHEPQSSLFSWLLDLLIEVLRIHIKELKLESFKLVQLFGKALIGKDSKQTKQATIILSYLVGRMSNNQVVLDPVSM